jgi:hypothetical protein
LIPDLCLDDPLDNIQPLGFIEEQVVLSEAHDDAIPFLRQHATVDFP